MKYRYRASIAGVASAQVLDVSDWQGKFDWRGAIGAVPNLAAGIYRITQGLGGSGTGSPDPDASWNHAAIRDVGLHRGVYHFFDPSLSGRAQAQYVVQELDHLGYTEQDMIFLDNETENVSPGAIAEQAAAFMTELELLLPYNPKGIYSNFNFANIGADFGLGKYPLWLAYPSSRAPQAPSPWVNWTFWQWGTRPAGGQTVDADAYNGTVAQLDAWIATYRPGINPVQGLHETRRGFTSIDLAWNGNAQALGYTVHAYWRGNLVNTYQTAVPELRCGHLIPAHTYTFSVRAHPGHSTGSDASVKVTTRP